MQPLDLIYPEETLSESEQQLIFEVFANNAVVRKYLRILGAESGKELLGISSLNGNTESLVQQHSVVFGKLSVLTTLLNIGVEK